MLSILNSPKRDARSWKETTRSAWETQAPAQAAAQAATLVPTQRRSPREWFLLLLLGGTKGMPEPQAARVHQAERVFQAERVVFLQLRASLFGEFNIDSNNININIIIDVGDKTNDLLRP